MNDNQSSDIRYRQTYSNFEGAVCAQSAAEDIRVSTECGRPGPFLGNTSKFKFFSHGPLAAEKSDPLAQPEDPKESKAPELPDQIDVLRLIKEHCIDAKNRSYEDEIPAGWGSKFSRLLPLRSRSRKRDTEEPLPIPVSQRMNRYTEKAKPVKPTGLSKRELYSYEAVRLQLLIHILHLRLTHFRPMRPFRGWHGIARLSR